MKRSVLCAVFVLFALTCAKKEEKLTGEQGGSIIVGTTERPSSLSPLTPSMFGSNEILDLLFMHLHRIDATTGTMKAELAASWEFSEDLTSITYYLRDDVVWWDGTPVTAEDIYYTYDKMKDPVTAYPNQSRFRFIKSVRVVNPHAITFTFDRVYADLLTDSDIMPVPKHMYEKGGKEFGKNPVGNGPYKVKEWIPDTRLVLAANDDYFRGKPPLDEISIRFYKNQNLMMQDFASGYLDIVLNITPQAARDFMTDTNVVIDSSPGRTYTYVGWNLNHPYLSDKDIRKALSMAIDRRAILDEAFMGMGAISVGPLPPSSWAFNEKIEPLEYSVSQAQEILRQKGFQDRDRNRVIDREGNDFVLEIITNSENPERVAMLDLIAADLRALGIRVQTRALSTEAFITALMNKKFDGFVMGWTVADKIDPTLYWHSDPARGVFNFVSYKNATVDTLMDDGIGMLNRKKAKHVWGEFQRIIYDDMPYTFLVVPNYIGASHRRVKGVEQGLSLASAYTYWIPKTEQVVARAAPMSERLTQVPEEAMPSAPTAQPLLRPEEVLEAAAKKETTATAPLDTAIAMPIPVPPKPSVITRATPTKSVKPQYPESARILGAAGRVVVRVVVGTDGRVKDATIISSFGNPACEAAAREAALQWEFTPAMKDGVPFEQNVTIPFDFQ